MALEIRTNNPAALLASIKKAIDDEKVVTWSYDSANDFTHTAEQWNEQAWLKPEIDVKNNILKLTLLKPKSVDKIEKSVRGVYQGRFIEMLVTHFSNSFTTAAVVV